MPNPDYTLDDLERLTGFTRRQIRFYITRKLVPGAGDSRGPYAVYSAEALLRLRAIAHLKDLRIPPTGRTMTLEEIGHALDSYSTFELQALVDGQAKLAAIDTDDDEVMCMREEVLPEAGPDSASDYLAGIRAHFEAAPERPRPSAPRGAPDDQRATAGSGLTKNLSIDPTPRTDTPTQEIHTLLTHLQSLLARLGKHTRYMPPEGLDQWQRITTRDIEIHIRQPNDHRAKARLAALARSLADILEGEEES